MLFHIIIGLLLAILVGGSVIIVQNSILIIWAYFRFKRNLKGVKIIDGFSPLDGHMRTVVFRPFLIHTVPKLAQKYGQTFAYMYGSLPHVMTHDLDLIKRLVVDEQAINRMKANVPVKEMEFDNIFIAEDIQWRRLRRAIAPAFKSNKFKAPNVISEIDRSIEKFLQALEVRLDESETKGQTVINIDDLAHRYSLDLTFSCLYKQDKAIDFFAESDPMTKTVDEGLEAVMFNPMMRLSITLPPLRGLIDWLVLHCHPQGAWRKLLMGFIKQQTKLNFEARKQIQRMKEAGKQVDEENVLLENGTKYSRNMIDGVIDQFHEGKLTQSEYFHSSFFLLGAADKTSADSIAHTLYQLGINKEIQEKLRKSIKLHGLKSEYLTWVMNESLRLHPPAPLGCSRTVERDLEDSSGCILVPAKSILVSPTYSIHRLEAYWGPDAEEFKPERFADTSGFHPFQFIPFGAGPRMCPGKEFALFEMRKLLCALMTRYSFHCKPTEMRYNSPLFVYTLSEKPTLVTISRL